MIAAGADSATKNVEDVKILGVYAGMPAPDFKTAGVGRDDVKLSDYKGKLVYLDFWATWCTPCVEAMPRIQKVYDEYKNDGLVVVLVSLDDKPTKVKDFLTKKKLPGIQAHGAGGMKGDLARLYNIEGVPTNFLIGPDGKVLANDVDAGKLRSAVRKQLAKMKTPETQPTEAAAAAAH